MSGSPAAAAVAVVELSPADGGAGVVGRKRMRPFTELQVEKKLRTVLNYLAAGHTRGSKKLKTWYKAFKDRGQEDRVHEHLKPSCDEAVPEVEESGDVLDADEKEPGAARKRADAGRYSRKRLSEFFPKANLDVPTPNTRPRQTDIKRFMDVAKTFDHPKRMVRALEAFLGKPVIEGAMAAYGEMSVVPSKKTGVAMKLFAEGSKESMKVLAKSRTADANAARRAVARIGVSNKTIQQRAGKATARAFGLSGRAVYQAAKEKVELLAGSEPSNVTWCMMQATRRSDEFQMHGFNMLQRFGGTIRASAHRRRTSWS
mmetsp:Transcript_11883/g.30054  ORF Transcript_11883/g.30054 Transcript_11883/m.30054 type:complete len:315 (+) Transcript_11883:90-1034(+)